MQKNLSGQSCDPQDSRETEVGADELCQNTSWNGYEYSFGITLHPIKKNLVQRGRMDATRMLIFYTNVRLIMQIIP